MLRILVIEDEPSYVEALEVALEREGFEVASALDGRQGLEVFRRDPPDVVLLDLMLPGIQGLDVLRRIRDAAATPVIVVSAKDSEADVVTALELGADDYLRKPYSIRELVARIHVAVRRTVPLPDEQSVLSFGTAVLDLGRYELRVGDEVFELPRKEFQLLRALMERAGRVATRERLLEEVWGLTWSGTSSKTLDQHIRRLRRRFEDQENAPQIETIRGVGYRLTKGDAG